MFDRQQEFIKLLMRHGVQIEALIHDFGFHSIDLVDMGWANTIMAMAAPRAAQGVSRNTLS